MPGTTDGVIRRARRPEGWVPRGPAPRAPSFVDRPDLLPGTREDLCFLAGDWRILQRTDGHRYSLDDLLTAWESTQAMAGATPKRVLDLGCGIGSVLLFLAWRWPTARCLGLEAQELSAGLARRSIALNGVGDRCEVRLGDLREPTSLDDAGAFDIVSGTPPYFLRGSGVESPHVQRGPCRFIHRGGIEAYAAAAAQRLAPGARFVACDSAGQRARVDEAARAAGLLLETWRDVIPKEGKPPLIALFRMRRGDDRDDGNAHADATRAVPATTRTLPPLVIRDHAGRRTPAFVAVRDEMGMPP